MRTRSAQIGNESEDGCESWVEKKARDPRDHSDRRDQREEENAVEGIAKVRNLVKPMKEAKITI